ncbi:MAG TPA: hypothetical protein VMB49_06550 [Acidobacteriaceae bacterium]|nr:hypothetical protein [Acidobacteriaceae bacterium]
MIAPKQLLRCIVLGSAILPFVAASPQTQKPATTSPQKKPGSFWDGVLRFFGVSATTSTLKGAGDEIVSGQVWVTDVRANTCHKVTSDGGYRSPVFFPDGNDILAIRGEDVVRLNVNGSTQQSVAKVIGVTKLVGFSRDDPSQVLLLAEDNAGQAHVGLLSVKDGKVTQVPYDPQSNRDRQMVEDLQGWLRSYDTGTVYVRRESFETNAGTVELTNVFWKQPGLDPVNVSRCELRNCGQPSASNDGSRIAFIKALD